jgi:hypothetical protein
MLYASTKAYREYIRTHCYQQCILPACKRYYAHDLVTKAVALRQIQSNALSSWHLVAFLHGLPRRSSDAHGNRRVHWVALSPSPAFRK